ncbi:MarR family winged helix-turn-helix transcriptional regulator [Pseudoalteromonas sp. MMG012]|uniref:MarR family winged helix-turn-helix transcriptional regulator n=1 Tax=Pseudoalteromonas sp. MMG012 TaxID=2822686 RepID=UPI001B3A0F85|nr:MarR family transcriptional regulator [Pseudoalteromonas sp. MMG012]MBQ4852212.1 MarR family transcriptional regulator [Pseudoalteromonas sp. MMG012]
MSYEQLKLKNQLCHRLYMASNSITRRYRPHLEALDLTYPQYVVMMALWEQDNITIAQLRELTAIDGGALTLILKKMTTKSLIRIVSNENDKRKKHVKLLAGGLDLKVQAQHIPEQIKCNFSNVNEEEVNDLIALLDKVLVNLD